MTTVGDFAQMLPSLLSKADRHARYRDRRHPSHHVKRLSRWLDSSVLAKECARDYLDRDDNEALEHYRECLKKHFALYMGRFQNPAVKQLDELIQQQLVKNMPAHLENPAPRGERLVFTYTTAPADYDWFGTRTIRTAGYDKRGKTIRLVASDPKYAESQRQRYMSGLHMAADDTEWEKLVRYGLVTTELAANPRKRDLHGYGPRVCAGPLCGKKVTGKSNYCPSCKKKMDASSRSMGDAFGDVFGIPPKGLAANPLVGTGTALVALVGAAWWLFLRKKKLPEMETPAVASPATQALLTPGPLPPAPAPTPPPPVANCAGKLVLEYKFTNQAPAVQVARRLYIWDPADNKNYTLYGDRGFAPATTQDLFAPNLNTGVAMPSGYIEVVGFEFPYKLKDQRTAIGPERYLAEAWLQTNDGWCLRQVDTNYEPWK